MRAHAYDLRAEVAADFGITDEQEADQLVHLIAANWRQAALSSADLALCAYAEKLTLDPAKMGASDIDLLREAGFDDRGIHDATQVISYFNYINRVADGLGIETESFVRPWERQAHKE